MTIQLCRFFLFCFDSLSTYMSEFERKNKQNLKTSSHLELFIHYMYSHTRTHSTEPAPGFMRIYKHIRTHTTHTYTYINTQLVYVDIERAFDPVLSSTQLSEIERERERDIYIYIYICVCVCIYMYIYIYT